MSLFVVLCFAIPICSFTYSIVKSSKARERESYKAFMARRNQTENLKERVAQMARKQDVKTWKMRDGSVVQLATMTDGHLANAIRMVARNCHKNEYGGDMKEDKSFLKLVNEGRRRKFQITILNTPTMIHGRKEYVDVFIPKLFPTMKIAASILPSDWDSRPQE